MVNDRSLDGVNNHVDFFPKTGNFVIKKSLHSVKHVIEGSIRVHSGFSEGNSDIVLLFSKEVRLVIEWSLNFSSVLIANLC